MSALGVVLAHAGPSGLTDTRWLAVSTAGAGLTLAALAAAVAAVLAIGVRAERVRRGDLSHLQQAAFDRPSFAALAACSLACQGSAHVALLAAGVPAHGGPTTSLAMHVLLGAAVAGLVWATDRAVCWATAGLAEAIAAALDALRVGQRSWTPVPDSRPLAATHRGSAWGRAPPILA